MKKNRIFPAGEPLGRLREKRGFFTPLKTLPLAYAMEYTLVVGRAEVTRRGTQEEARRNTPEGNHYRSEKTDDTRSNARGIPP